MSKLAIAPRPIKDRHELVPRFGLYNPPSHGENRGSGPLGSANDFSILAPQWNLVRPASPTFLQWTVLQKSVRDHAVIVGSRRLEAICAVTAEPA